MAKYDCVCRLVYPASSTAAEKHRQKVWPASYLARGIPTNHANITKKRQELCKISPSGEGFTIDFDFIAR